jgi:carbon monoxide dehydrogenase subunit G
LKSYNGKSISIKQNGRGILAEMTVAAEPDRAWHVLTSFEEMSAQLSGFSTSKILQKEDNYRLVEQTVRVGIPLLPFSFRVVMSVVEDRPYLRFRQLRGSFSSFRGHWWIDPESTGNGTRIQYFLEASLAGGWKGGPVRRQIKSMIYQNLEELAVWIDNGGI